MRAQDLGGGTVPQARPGTPDDARHRSASRRTGLSSGHARQRDLDLAELDAIATHLDLEVGAAEVHELAIGTPAREIAGAIDARIRSATEPIRDEALVRQIGPLVIAERDPITADAQLSGDPDGREVTMIVEDPDLGVVDRLADRDRTAAGSTRPPSTNRVSVGRTCPRSGG